ncbi:MAG: MBL fold metallo-hydrolase [Akkermansiaceae bacterium]|nr:MBL fold metallo-hydrolase [Armatimonadota bacterium]
MTVSTYSEPGMASVNSYIVDAGAGVVVIDAQRSLSSARKLSEQIRETQKRVLGIFLTHPHPDHFGGMSVLAKAFPDAPRYALQDTRDVLQSDQNGYTALSKEVLGDDFDADIPLPGHIVAAGDTITLGDETLVCEDAGLGEATCMLMLHLPEHDTLFCADVVQHGMTAFLLEGHLEAWLEQIARVARTYGGVGTVYPGHGASGTASNLFGFQTAYLETFRRLLIANREPDGSLAEEGKRNIIAGMNHDYPGYLPVAAIPDLLEQDVDAIQKATG